MKFQLGDDSRLVRWLCFLIVLINETNTLLLVSGGGINNGSNNNDESSLKKILAKQCRSLDSMRHLSELEDLIGTIKEIRNLPVSNSDDSNYSGGLATSWSDFLALLPDPAKLCLEQAQAILDLEPIISERDNVCQPSHIELLEVYKKKYLARSEKANHRATKRFFNLYTNQVAFICKHNMMNSLQLADEKLINKDNYAKVMPWLVEPPSECPEIASNSIKPENGHDDHFSYHAGTGQLISESLIREETDLSALRCKAIEALSSVRSINELVEVMEKDSTASDENNPASQGDKSKRGLSVSNMMLVIPDNMRPTVENMLEACHQFEQIYSQTIISIVRLIQMGYNPTYKKFDEKCRADTLAQRWFSLTLICHSMLRSRLADQKGQADFKDELADHKTGLIVVDDQIIPNETTSSGDNQNLFKNIIEDELWVGKYLPGRFKRFRTRYVSTLLQVFKIDKLRNSVVFKKNVKRGRSIIVTLIFVGLTLLGINSSSSL